MIATLVYRKQIKLTTTEIDNANIAVSDYSIQINNLPRETNGTLMCSKYF